MAPHMAGASLAASVAAALGQDHRIMMDDSVQKSCWGVALKAVVAFGVAMAAIWLIGGGDSAAVLAAAG
jgi:hypothetical protein